MDKEWKDSRQPSNLGKLHDVLIRLLRLSLFEKLNQGETQLKTMGLDPSLHNLLTQAKREFIGISAYNKDTETDEDSMLIVRHKRTDF